MTSNLNEISRGTKCFGATAQNRTSDCKGQFPAGFSAWLKQMGWWGEKRVYLCSGGVEDAEAIRVDIRPETKPTHCEDARKTSLPSGEFDLVILDPPYSLDLAKTLYGTEEHFSGINGFTPEAARICKPNGLIITLTYEIPKRIKGCDFIAVWGIYQIPAMSYMRCLTVSKKGVQP